MDNPTLLAYLAIIGFFILFSFLSIAMLWYGTKVQWGWTWVPGDRLASWIKNYTVKGGLGGYTMSPYAGSMTEGQLWALWGLGFPITLLGLLLNPDTLIARVVLVFAAIVIFMGMFGGGLARMIPSLSHWAGEVGDYNPKAIRLHAYSYLSIAAKETLTKDDVNFLVGLWEEWEDKMRQDGGSQDSPNPFTIKYPFPEDFVKTQAKDASNKMKRVYTEAEVQAFFKANEAALRHTGIIK